MQKTAKENIEIEINKLKFFARQLQHKLKCPPFEALSIIAYQSLKISSWSLVRNSIEVATEEQKQQILLTLGAYNLAFGATHQTNYQYGFDYWLSIGNPIAEQIYKSKSSDNYYVIAAMFHSLANQLQNHTKKLNTIESKNDASISRFYSELAIYQTLITSEYADWFVNEQEAFDLYVQDRLEDDIWLEYSDPIEVPDMPELNYSELSNEDIEKRLNDIDKAMRQTYDNGIKIGNQILDKLDQIIDK